MDGRHLGHEDRVAFLLHLLREKGAAEGGGPHLPGLRVLIADAEGRQQGAHADAGRAEVVDLINLEHRVNLAGAGQDIADLIRGDGVETAAKGIELDEVKVVGLLDVLRSGVET